jgi:outer membrane cobalamin receptor
VPLEDRSQPPYHSLYELTSHQGRIQFDWNTTKDVKLGINATLRRDELEDKDLLWPGITNIGRALNNSRGFGLHTETHLSLPLSAIQFKIISSLRYDAIDFHHEGKTRTDDTFNPHLGLLISRAKGYMLSLMANWGRSFRAPTFADLFYQDFRIQGNPDLKPESSDNIDIGVKVGIPIHGWLGIEADYFRRHIDDLIIWRMGSFSTFSPFNTNALISGWEFSGDWSLLEDRLNIYLSHIVLEPLNKSGERTTHDKVLPYQAKHSTKMGVTLNLRYISFDYTRRFVGERFVTEANTVIMEPFSVDDVSVLFSRRVKGGDIRLKVSVLNLFDEEYEMIERAPLPGRHWRGSVEVSF